MSIKYIHQDISEDTPEKLPLIRDYCKKQDSLGIEVYEIPQIIRCLTQSKNAEWIKVDTDRCTGLVHADSSLGKTLIKLIGTLKGKGKALVIIPHKKGKLGFSIGIDDELTVFYSYNNPDGYKQGYLWASNGPETMKKIQEELSAEKILLEPSIPLNSSVPTQEVRNFYTDELTEEIIAPSEKVSQRRQKRDSSHKNGANV